ncbi:MAG: PIN domain-containing protein [Candidatus Aminicenantes bacterium]|nr:MAG: PIN domain-containing protein [Candidatus Aminicenantes bacterium]
MRKKKRIYLDMCALNRPFDELVDFRSKMEAQAIIFLIHRIIDEKYILCNSDIIEYEWSQIPMVEKKFLVKKIMDLSEEKITLDEEVTKLAEEFENSGMKAYDALHLASSIRGRCDCFISTDDKFVKKAKKNTEKIKVFNPLEFYILEVLN